MSRFLTLLLGQKLASFLVLIILLLSILFFGSTSGASPQTLGLAMGGVALGYFGLYLLAQQRGVKAAVTLEAALRQQGFSELSGARPDNRSSIEEAQRQFLESLSLLKQSRMGKGALHAMPWFLLIGPSGSGKSTLLRQSGISFPYMTKSRSKIRGLGGTKNCDWWFADRGILLDTAGRYVTEEGEEDREEWLAFLKMLRKARSPQPVNGAIVALSLADIIEADEATIQEHADKIRNRLDELTRELDVVFPVYVVFTKCDRLRGFVEMFDSLNKDERKQVWGFTFAYGRPKMVSDEAEFEKNIDELFSVLATRRIKLMSTESIKRRRAQQYVFPLQFARARDNLMSFFGLLQQENRYQEASPIRGVYFTSGTQEGSVIDKILSWAKPAELESEVLPENRKCYFVDDLFNKIVFEDAPLACPTQASLKARRLGRAIGAAAAGLAAVALLWWGFARWSAHSDCLAAARDYISKEGDTDGAAQRKRLAGMLRLMGSQDGLLRARGLFGAMETHYRRQAMNVVIGHILNAETKFIDQVVNDIQESSSRVDNRAAGWYEQAKGNIRNARDRLETISLSHTRLKDRSKDDIGASKAYWQQCFDGEPSDVSQAHFDAFWGDQSSKVAERLELIDISTSIGDATARLIALEQRVEAVQVESTNSSANAEFDRFLRRGFKDDFPNTIAKLEGKETCRLDKLLGRRAASRPLAGGDATLLRIAILREHDGELPSSLNEVMAAMSQEESTLKARQFGGRSAQAMGKEAEWLRVIETRKNQVREEIERKVQVAWVDVFDNYGKPDSSGSSGEVQMLDDAAAKELIDGLSRLQQMCREVFAKIRGELPADRPGPAGDPSVKAPEPIIVAAVGPIRSLGEKFAAVKKSTELKPLADELQKEIDKALVVAGTNRPDQRTADLTEKWRQCDQRIVEAIARYSAVRARLAIESEFQDVARRWGEVMKVFPFNRSGNGCNPLHLAERLTALIGFFQGVDEVRNSECVKGVFTLRQELSDKYKRLQELAEMLLNDNGKLSVDLSVKIQKETDRKIEISGTELDGANPRRCPGVPSYEFVKWPIGPMETIECKAEWTDAGQKFKKTAESIVYDDGTPLLGTADGKIASCAFAILRLWDSGTPEGEPIPGPNETIDVVRGINMTGRGKKIFTLVVRIGKKHEKVLQLPGRKNDYQIQAPLW